MTLCSYFPHNHGVVASYPTVHLRSRQERGKRGKGKQVLLLEKQNFFRNPNSWIFEQNCHRCIYLSGRVWSPPILLMDCAFLTCSSSPVLTNPSPFSFLSLFFLLLSLSFPLSLTFNKIPILSRKGSFPNGLFLWVLDWGTRSPAGV